MITALLLGAVAVYLLAHKNNSVSGIGATRKRKAPRRIWKELEAAQRAGIDLSDPNGWENNKGVLDRIMFTHEATPHSKSSKPTHQLYFNQLRRAYKSIAGTTLPHDQSVIKNEYGDTVLVYNDYHLDQLPARASEYILNETLPGLGNDYSAIGYWATIAAIAQGQKFVWTSKGVHRGVQQLVFGGNNPSERKARISYLASLEKGGMYPEMFAHKVWESYTDGNGDDQEITDGVLEALRTCTSVGQAQEACVNAFISAHQSQEPLLYEDVPF